MSAGKVFFDTNVLLLSMHGDDGPKRSRAEKLFQECSEAKLAVVSTQVIREFYAAWSRKLRTTRPELRAVTIRLMELDPIVLGVPQIKSAMHLEERY